MASIICRNSPSPLGPFTSWLRMSGSCFVKKPSKPYSVWPGVFEIDRAVAIKVETGIHAQQSIVAVGVDVA